MTKARIYKPAKSATQSARGRMEAWVLEYEAEKKKGPESLMGWTAAGDTLEQVRLKFKTREEAAQYARNKGLDYSIDQPQERKIKPRNYGDNFKYVPAKAKS